jgi:hypothetical protein
MVCIAGPGFLRWQDVTQYLAETRVELRGRLPSLGSIPDYPGPPSTIVVERAKEMLGMEKYIGWKQTVDDTVDDILGFRNQCRKRFWYRGRFNCSTTYNLYSYVL